jgi:hypothetical protein
MVLRGVERVDLAMVKAYAQGLMSLLEEAYTTYGVARATH